MKRLLLAIGFIGCTQNVLALSFDISESRLNNNLQTHFPKTHKNITMSQPVLRLFERYAIICAHFQHPLFAEPLYGCGQIKAEWNNKDASLWMTPLALTELNWKQRKAPNILLESINQYVMPHINALKVYQNPSWMASHVERIELKPKKAVIYF